jgi:MerR family transcriptional regulator, copper efflux regulator
MDSTVSYSISEAAELLNLSAKTIRRYIKSGKLPSTKVPTKFGDEYRITEIPETLKQEAAEQADANNKVEMVQPEDSPAPLDSKQLYNDNLQLAVQLGAASARIRQLEDQIKALTNQLQADKEPLALPQPQGQPELVQALQDNIKLMQANAARPWWKRLFGLK